MDEQQCKQLDEQGYLIFKNILPAAQIEIILSQLEELWAMKGDHAGEENYIEPGVRCLANLANKGEIFRSLYSHPQVLKGVETVMGRDVRAAMVNAWDVPPHTGVRMPFHMDSDKGRVSDAIGYSAATAIWMLDEFTVANGATAFVPGSHLPGKSPKEVLAGLDVLVFYGHCWHAGRPNETEEHRRAIIIHYLRADVPRPESRRQHVDADHVAVLAPRERVLLGLDDE